MDSDDTKLATTIQAINFAIEIGVRYIILEGDLAYVIDMLWSKEKDLAYVIDMVEAAIGIIHGHKDNFIDFYKYFKIKLYCTCALLHRTSASYI